MAQALIILSYLYMFMIFFISFKYFTTYEPIDVNINIFYLLITLFIAILISYSFKLEKLKLNEYFYQVDYYPKHINSANNFIYIKNNQTS